MPEERKIWTVNLNCAPYIPCVHEWVYMGETEHCIRIKYNRVIKTLSKKNNAFFFDKEGAIRHREDVITLAIKKLELQLDRKCAIIVEPSEPPPTNIKL